MDINSRLKKLQSERNWTVNHMASEANINPGTILNWYNRKSTPSIDCLECICNAFRITLSQFFNESDEVIELSDTQKEFLAEFDLLDKDAKEEIIKLMKIINKIQKSQ